MATGYSQAVAIKAELISELVAAQGVGNKLESVVSIAGTSYSETGVFPYIGVEIIRLKEAFVANHKIRITIDFRISVSCKSTNLLIDAYNQRDIIMDDGNGNGIQPILRASMYTLLANLIESSEITDTILLSNVSANKASAPVEFFADAVIMWTAKQTINV